MALDLSKVTPPTPPATKNGAALRPRIVLASCILGVAGLVALLWWRGVSVQRAWQTPPVSLETLEVIAAPLAITVVETGTIESASNTTIRCQVEALTGLVGGSTGTTTRTVIASAAPASTASANTSGKASADKATAQKKQAQQAAKKAARKMQAEGQSGGGTVAGAGKSAGGGGGGGGSSGSSGAASSGGSSDSSSKGSKGSSSSTASSSTTTVTQKPSIRSFQYEVKPYTSLQTKRVVSTSAIPKAAGSSGGGGNRGGGGGGGGGNGNTEKPGSTRIIMIREEGSSVAAGDIVCEFDSSAFQDAVLAQRIRADTAKSQMVQAQAILEVNQIALEEYRDGIYAQDLMLIRQYLSTCHEEQDRARRNVDWSQSVLDKNFRAPQQHQAEILLLQRAEIALVVADLMEQRLINATGPKITRSLEANLQANRADALALEAAYGIEADRLRRLEKMVDNCVLRAPHEGTVVYSMPASNGWRPATPAIMEGATVREGQPIFELPDPKRMRVRAKINESKVSSIQPGQRASIRVDAFPERELRGTVASVTLIPAPAAGPMSDVKIYFANITFDASNFEGLRPGLSAEVTFLVDQRPAITQVPIKAVRWVDGAAYAAISTSADRSQYRWQPLKIGSMGVNYAEVIRGLQAGDRVVAHPDVLLAPQPAAVPATLQASDVVPTRPTS